MGACPCSAEKKAPAEDVTAGDPPEEEPLASTLKFTVSIVSARGVRTGEWFPGTGDRGDCFCVVKIAGTDEVLYKTQDLQQTSVEPRWNEEFEIAEHLPGDALEFSVWDCFSEETKVPEGSTNKLVGRVTLPSSMFEESGFNGELELENTGKNITAAHLTLKIKVEDQEYPDEVDPEFSIGITRDPKAPLGVDLDTQDDNMLYVSGVKSGPFQLYNSTVKSTDQLKQGQFIVQVNGVAGNTALMAENLKKHWKLDLVVRRSMEMTVPIDKKEKKTSLGLEFPKVNSNNLMIVDIIHGPVYAWNCANPDLEVRTGDRIVAVNGQGGKASDLQKKLKALDKFQLTVVRPLSTDPPKSSL